MPKKRKGAIPYSSRSVDHFRWHLIADPAIEVWPLAGRYERRSLLVTSDQPFVEWTSVFPDATMTLAAVDRLVHHAVILEMNVENYRRRAAASRHKPRNSSDTKRDTKAKELTTEPVA